MIHESKPMTSSTGPLQSLRIGVDKRECHCRRESCTSTIFSPFTFQNWTKDPTSAWLTSKASDEPRHPVPWIKNFPIWVTLLELQDQIALMQLLPTTRKPDDCLHCPKTFLYFPFWYIRSSIFNLLQKDWEVDKWWWDWSQRYDLLLQCSLFP